jgi:hypothetical protein
LTESSDVGIVKGRIAAMCEDNEWLRSGYRVFLASFLSIIAVAILVFANKFIHVQSIELFFVGTMPLSCFLVVFLKRNIVLDSLSVVMLFQ